jgi:thiosulfate reductase cytochrome b subunit
MADLQYVTLFTRFERFWHWAQAALVLTLLVTGARLHGLISGPDWHAAFRLHLVAAGLIILLWIFAIFWHFTTGQWRHYIPTRRNLWPVIRYYAWGIFLGEAHPAKPTLLRKHNPLQRISYLALKLLINPAIWITGILYLTVGLTGLPLATVAWTHVVAAWAMALFVVVHVYMATTGATPLAYVRAMITGKDWVAVDPAAGDRGR